jgi:hypothetical protein
MHSLIYHNFICSEKRIGLGRAITIINTLYQQVGNHEPAHIAFLLLKGNFTQFEMIVGNHDYFRLCDNIVSLWLSRYSHGLLAGGVGGEISINMYTRLDGTW